MIKFLDIISIMAGSRPRAAKYRRISDDSEGRELGVKRQDEDLDALAERLGLEVVEDYVDNDISASTKSKAPRPDYDRMLADARAGAFDVIMCYSSSRLTRRPRENEDLIELALKHKIRFVYVRSPEWDLNTADGREYARMAAARDAGEAERIAERVARKHRQRAEAGEDIGGGSRPFGYERDRKTVREHEAVLIREAARAVLDTGQTIHAVCRDWNGREIATVSGGRWTPHVMRRMLMSARISGRREHKGVIVASAKWNGIITHDQSDQLRELLSDPRRTTNQVGNARRYLLTGYTFCGRCGSKLKARPYPNRDRSYVCAVDQAGGVPLLNGEGMCGRGNLRVHADGLELYVTEAALDYLDEFVNLAAAISVDRGDEESVLWTSLNGFRQRIERLDTDYYVHNRLDEARYQRLTGELAAQVEQTEAAIARVRTRKRAVNVPTSSEQARKLWDERGFDWRRTLLTTLVERVTIGPGVRGRNKFDPGRVSITFRRPA